MKSEDLQGLCNDILESDRSLRFVGISDKTGKQVISSYRAGLNPLLTPYELEMYAIESVLRMKTRKDFESKLEANIHIHIISEIKKGNSASRERRTPYPYGVV
jgi:hypothetical protein